MNLIATRNFRVVVALVGLLTVVIFLATLRNLFTPEAAPINAQPEEKLTPVVDTDAVAPPKPAGNAPPYPKEDGNTADKVVAGKEGANDLPKNPPKEDNKDTFVLGSENDEEPPTKVGEKPKAKPEEQKADKLNAEKPKADKPKTKTPSGECTKYVVMIDAGSLGSRVHTYKFDTCQSPPAVLAEDFKMLKPGLLSFDSDVVGAADSLNPLLDAAVAFVPKEYQKCTPIAVKATAGLRKLGEEKSNAILAQVRSHLETAYPFPVVKGNDGIEVMEGLDEGYYAWITTNLLLGTIGGDTRENTAAVFDLGGGLTQIVFEPKQGHEVAVPEMKREFEFGGHKYSLYEYSHLGYGINEARNKLNRLIITDDTKKTLTKHTLSKLAKAAEAHSVPITNVCLPPGVTATQVVEMGIDEFYHVTFTGGKDHLGALCRGLVEKILFKDAACDKPPCSIKGVHQPLLTKSFEKDADMFAFSFFYDRTNPLGFPLDFTVGELRDLARDVCGGSDLAAVFAAGAREELEKEPFWCMDLLIITGLLHTGYEIPLAREVKTAQKIGGFEIGWCLGALLPLLEGKGKTWECRA